MAFRSLGNSDHVVVSISINFQLNSKRDAPFHRTGYDYSHAAWDSLCDHLKNISREDIFKLNACDAVCEFWESFQVGINVYIFVLNIRSSLSLPPWFSVVCSATIVHRNHFFCLYQQNKTSESKLKLRKANYCCKRVLEASKLAYVNKKEESMISQKLCSWDFWRITNSVFNER